MIYLERTIDIKKGVGSIDEPVILYKGDKNVEIQFTIKNNPFKSKKSLTPTYGQLVIDREATSIFSDVSSLNNGKVIFVITEQMIDELIEIGEYAFQIRLFNDDKTSRATLPVINGGIIIKQPICDGEENVANINKATVNDAIVPYSEPESVFNQDGNYNKTIWTDGDLITDSKLNKVEDALDYLVTESKTHVTEAELNAALEDVDVDLSGYATEQYVQDAINTIELTPGPQGEQGPEGPAGKDGKDGAAFTYDMFTESQLETLRGPKGEPGKDGVNGEQGPKGDTGEPGTDFTYDMFTPEQLEALRGPSGKDGVDGATGLQGEKGDKGDTGEQGPKGDTGEPGKDFTYDMFTPEQLEALRGPQGEPGPVGQDGKDGEQGIQGERGEKGDKGDKGEPGPEGPQGPKGDTPSLEGYATEQYVQNAIQGIETGDVDLSDYALKTDLNNLVTKERADELEEAIADLNTEVNDFSNALGDIDSILDAINGEVL